MQFNATVKGFRQAEINIQGLADKIGRTAMRAALSKAATPIVKEARKRTPKNTGALRKSLTKRVVTDKKSGIVQVKIAPRKGFTIEVNGRRHTPSRYAHLVEFGSSRSRARPFMRPAHDIASPQAKEIYKRDIADAIKRAAKRLNKKFKP